MVKNVYATIYNQNTKLIDRVIFCPKNQIDVQLKQDELYILGKAEDTISKYVLDSDPLAITNRPASISAVDKTIVIANGIDKIVLSGTPIGATVTLGDITSVSDGTDIDLIFDIPGVYNLKVELPPYLPFEQEINAT